MSMGERGQPNRFRNGRQGAAHRRDGEMDEAFEILFEAAPISILVVDANGAIMLLNRQTEDMFGYARAELVGRPVEILVPARLRSTHVDWRGRVALEAPARPMGTGGTLRALRRNGDEFPVEIGLNPVRIGSECLVISTIVDITLRKRAEDHQRMFEYGHATLATCQLLGMPAAVLQRDGRIMLLNPRMANLRSQLRVVGDRFEFANPAEHERLLKALAGLDIDANAHKTHLMPVHTGGDHPPLVFHLMAINAPLGDVVAVLVVTMLDSASIPSADLVQGLFALAPAEARIAVAMSTGLSPRQAAHQLGISEGNVRTALKRIFAKTGVSRQSELAALLARLRLH